MTILARVVLVCRIRKIRSSKSGVSPIKKKNILSAVHALYVKKGGSRTAMCNIL